MSLFDSRFYCLNKFNLSIIGQWPYQSRLGSIVTFTVTILFTGSLTSLELLGLIKGRADFNTVMENATILLINCILFIKLFNCFYFRHYMKVLLIHIEEVWKQATRGPEKKILQNYAERGRFLTIGYMGVMYMGIILYCLAPFTNSDTYLYLPLNKTYSYKLMYRLEYVFDVETYFIPLMLHTFLGEMYLAFITSAIDTMFVVYILHICALFEIIRYNIESIKYSHSVKLRPNTEDDEAYHVIIKCIKLYDHALRFAEALSSAHAMSFLFLLGDIIISLSFTGAELIIEGIQLEVILKIISGAVPELLHIYFLSLTCQWLIDHSMALRFVIYSSNWYTYSLKSRQLLCFMMLRAGKPCEIKAGKIYVMSMENFSAIIKASMSYFMMLISMQ